MSNRDRLIRLAAELPEDLAGELANFGEYLAAKRLRKADDELDAETRAWMDADLAPPIEPYDWGPEGPPKGKPIRYEPGVGFVIEGGRDG